MTSTSSHHDGPEFASGGIIPASEAAGCQGPCDEDCEIAPAHCWNWHRPNHKRDWHDPRECDARRDAAAELTRLAEELGLDDIPPDEAVALCREARRELAAEDDERRRIARRRPPHWAGDDDGR